MATASAFCFCGAGAAARGLSESLRGDYEVGFVGRAGRRMDARPCVVERAMVSFH